MNTGILKWRWLIGLVVLATILGSRVEPVSTAPEAEIGDSMASLSLSPASPLDTPIVVVGEPHKDFVVTDGLLYWSQFGDGDVYLRRKPTHGGATLNISSTLGTTEDENFGRMAGDDTGIYYYNANQGQIEFRSAGTPTDPPTVLASGLGSGGAPVAKLDLDDTYVYWASDDNRILRVPKAGGTVETMANTGSSIWDIEPSYLYIHWVDSGGLWKMSKSCSPLPCTTKILADGAVTGYGLRHVPNQPNLGDYTVFYLGIGAPWKIHRYACGGFPFESCGVDTIYTAPNNDLDLSRPAFGGCPTSGHRCLYWKEVGPEPVRAGDNSEAPRMRRLDLDNLPSGAETIVGSLDNRYGVVETDELGVYFQMNDDFLGTLPFTATAITHDLVAGGLEVTQVLQDMANSVPLVADKPTYVRGYGSNAAGPQANMVTAILNVKVNGGLLDTLNPLISYKALAVGDTYDRGDYRDGWLFKIPEDLDQIEDTVTLELVVDPNEFYDDPNRDNNRISVDVDFEYRPPACTVFIPVRTHAPPASTSLPNFYDMVDLYERLWPVPDVWVYRQSGDISELDVCWEFIFPYLCHTPFELDEGWSILPPFLPDKDKAIAELFIRWLFSNDPAACADNGSPVHYVGMVHPDSTMTTHGGYANYYSPVSYLKLPPTTGETTKWSWPHAGSTLAHEITHNYDRRHVDCGNPSDIVNDYPYDPCQIDDIGPDNHYGFDINQLVPIRPNYAADYMSYAPTRWVSDYTYEAIYAALLPPLVPTSHQPASSIAGGQVLISGVVDQNQDQGYLGYAWVFPEAALSARIAEKFQTLAAPAFVSDDLLSPTASYHVRLLDASGAILADHAPALQQTESISEVSTTFNFVATLPEPPGEVAKIELLRDSTVLASRAPGGGKPSLEVLLPAGGETFDDSITISWQASDPDPDDDLLFNIQYSPDAGASWFSVVTDFPGAAESPTTTLALGDLLGFFGSNGKNGLIRVAASDGYNTTTSQSLPFEISDQPPLPHIVSPDAALTYPAGEIITLRGGATDPEDGGIEEGDLKWRLDGGVYDYGRETFVSGLAPGDYAISLEAEDSGGNLGSAQTDLHIERLQLPLNAAYPILDGDCNDEAYQSVHLELALYADGAQGSLELLRTGLHLYACFSNLPRGQKHISHAGLWVDLDNSQDTLAQSDDHGFFVSEDGGPFMLSGAGRHVLVDGLAARVSASDTHWNAEFRIDADALGGWNHLVGLAMGHFDKTASGDDYLWPYMAGTGHPASWAETTLGDTPSIESLLPSTALVGSGVFALTVDGGGFLDGDSVLFDGEIKNTTFISATQLQASIPAADLSTAGEFEVRVRSSDWDDYTTEALPFLVENPIPQITSLAPDSVLAGSEAFSLTVSGSGFVGDSAVQWNGEPLMTSYQSPTALKAAVPAEYLVYGRQVDVTVRNPGPGGGVSNIFIETITVGPAADLSVVKSDMYDPVMVSRAMTYTLQVTNNGPSDATNLILVDTLPNNTLFLRATGTGWTCTHDSGVVTCTRGSLSSSKSASVTVVVKPNQLGMITNSVSVSADEQDTDMMNNAGSETTQVVDRFNLYLPLVLIE
jgi:uncharacterized repeat protein (TIGR01451 family)